MNKTCIYDNPQTSRREYWRDGKMIGYYTSEFLDQAGKILTVTEKMLKHVCRFQPERLIGDKQAMERSK